MEQGRIFWWSVGSLQCSQSQIGTFTLDFEWMRLFLNLQWMSYKLPQVIDFPVFFLPFAVWRSSSLKASHLEFLEDRCKDRRCKLWKWRSLSFLLFLFLLSLPTQSFSDNSVSVTKLVNTTRRIRAGDQILFCVLSTAAGSAANASPSHKYHVYLQIRKWSLMQIFCMVLIVWLILVFPIIWRFALCTKPLKRLRSL